jgi:hypothetical protein
LLEHNEDRQWRRDDRNTFAADQSITVSNRGSPVPLVTGKTIDKACSLIEVVADNGASLCAFPEAYLPCLPLWAGYVRRNAIIFS